MHIFRRKLVRVFKLIRHIARQSIKWLNRLIIRRSENTPNTWRSKLIVQIKSIFLFRLQKKIKVIPLPPTTSFKSEGLIQTFVHCRFLWETSSAQNKLEYVYDWNIIKMSRMISICSVKPCSAPSIFAWCVVTFEVPNEKIEHILFFELVISWKRKKRSYWKWSFLIIGHIFWHFWFQRNTDWNVYLIYD